MAENALDAAAVADALSAAVQVNQAVGGVGVGVGGVGSSDGDGIVEGGGEAADKDRNATFVERSYGVGTEDGTPNGVVPTSSTTTTAATTTTTPTDPPPALPMGWIVKESQTSPGCYYYYHIDMGISSWYPPKQEEAVTNAIASLANPAVDASAIVADLSPEAIAAAAAAATAVSASTSASASDDAARSSKRRKTSSSNTNATATSTSTSKSTSNSSSPKQVRVLHILKKHKDSRRPSSWRQPKVTQTLEEAREEVQGLLELLLEVQDTDGFDELKATFEELARTESDCSSAKRGGDLGYFGRRKMQPTFEEASFGLQIGELTKTLVETSSGVHLILRIG